MCILVLYIRFLVDLSLFLYLVFHPHLRPMATPACAVDITQSYVIVQRHRTGTRQYDVMAQKTTSIIRGVIIMSRNFIKSRGSRTATMVTHVTSSINNSSSRREVVWAMSTTFAVFFTSSEINFNSLSSQCPHTMHRNVGDRCWHLVRVRTHMHTFYTCTSSYMYACAWLQQYTVHAHVHEQLFCVHYADQNQDHSSVYM